MEYCEKCLENIASLGKSAHDLYVDICEVYLEGRHVRLSQNHENYYSMLARDLEIRRYVITKEIDENSCIAVPRINKSFGKTLFCCGKHFAKIETKSTTQSQQTKN